MIVVYHHTKIIILCVGVVSVVARSHYVVQAGLELALLMLPSLQCWDYSGTPLNPARKLDFYETLYGCHKHCREVTCGRVGDGPIGMEGLVMDLKD